jgi:hypothetical protein
MHSPSIHNQKLEFPPIQLVPMYTRHFGTKAMLSYFVDTNLPLEADPPMSMPSTHLLAEWECTCDRAGAKCNTFIITLQSSHLLMIEQIKSCIKHAPPREVPQVARDMEERGAGASTQLHIPFSIEGGGWWFRLRSAIRRLVPLALLVAWLCVYYPRGTYRLCLHNVPRQALRQWQTF